MTTTERYSKANSLSSQTLHATEMGHYSLPAWKQQLLERKAVNERIWKQAESKKARAALTSLNKDFEKTTRHQTSSSDILPDVSHGFINDDQGSSVSLSGHANGPKSASLDKKNVKVVGNRHLELMSPQPYNNRNKLRNTMPLDASVVEEAVVKVKENPFKMMESEKGNIMKSHIRTYRPTEGNRPTTPEPIYMNAHIESQVPPRGRKTARVEPQISSQFQHNEVCEDDANIGKEFSHVRSIWESRDTKMSNRNFGLLKNHDASGSSKFHNVSRSRSNHPSCLKESVSPEVPHRVDSINVVANQFCTPSSDVEGAPDSMPSEMPLPNTVSSLKNVYECRDTQNVSKAGFKFRLRDKTPPPAGFRRIHTNNVTTNETCKLTVYQCNASTGGSSRDERPMATVRPVVLSKPAAADSEGLLQGPKTHTFNASLTSENENALVQDNVLSKPTAFKPVVGASTSYEMRDVVLNQETVTSIQYKDNVCVENYVPKFVHEYTSHRVTSLLNSLIRDSISFRVIPNAVTHHSPMTSSNAVIIESTKTTAFTNINSPSMSVLRNEDRGEKQERSVSKDDKASSKSTDLKSFEDPIPTVVLIEKPDNENRAEVYDASHKLFDSTEEVRLDDETSVTQDEHKTPTVVETEDACHPKILVFQQSFLGYKNSGSENKEKVFSRVESPQTGDILELEPKTLPVVTSFKDESPTDHRRVWEESTGDFCSTPSEGIESMKKKIGVKEAVVVLSAPLPPDLKSCISQKLKVSAGRKISFHEDVYVHEYPVSFWSSEEELRFAEAAEQLAAAEMGADLSSVLGGGTGSTSQHGGSSESKFEGAPLAAIEDEMDMFSPAGSLSDLVHATSPSTYCAAAATDDDHNHPSSAPIKSALSSSSDVFLNNVNNFGGVVGKETNLATIDGGAHRRVEDQAPVAGGRPMKCSSSKKPAPSPPSYSSISVSPSSEDTGGGHDASSTNEIPSKSSTVQDQSFAFYSLGDNSSLNNSNSLHNSTSLEDLVAIDDDEDSRSEDPSRGSQASLPGHKSATSFLREEFSERFLQTHSLPAISSSNINNRTARDKELQSKGHSTMSLQSEKEPIRGQQVMSRDGGGSDQSQSLVTSVVDTAMLF